MIQISYKENRPSLYLVSTPIGNLSDITLRALEVLKSVDVIFAEDTRVSGILLKHYEIKKPLVSYHEHNKHEQLSLALDYLNNNKSIALISDAGTPLISDPGNLLVDYVIKAGYNVIPISGASALLSSVVVSNMDLSSFMFIGFLPRKALELKEKINELEPLKSTLVFYESPHRINNTLKVLFEELGNRKVFIAREITKLYETFIWDELKNYEKLDLTLKGEFVIVVEGNNKLLSSNQLEEALKLVNDYLKIGADPKLAMKEAALKTGVSKNMIYNALKVKKDLR